MQRIDAWHHARELVRDWINRFSDRSEKGRLVGEELKALGIGPSPDAVEAVFKKNRYQGVEVTRGFLCHECGLMRESVMRLGEWERDSRRYDEGDRVADVCAACLLKALTEMDG